MKDWKKIFTMQENLHRDARDPGYIHHPIPEECKDPSKPSALGHFHPICF
jgi:hypothetical protein